MAQIKYRDPVTGVYVPVGAGEDGYPDPTGATAGHVWTADGTDGADWQAPPAGGGAVDSVNTQTGDVVLGAGDVGADPAGSAAAAQTAAESTAATALTAHHDAGSTDHDDRYYTEGEVDTALAGKEDTGVAAAAVTTHEAGASHDGRYYTESEMDALLAGKEDSHSHPYEPSGAISTHESGSSHDSRYYTESEVDAALTGKADTGHNHDGAYAATGHSHSGTDDHTHTAYETAVQEDQTYPGITTIALVTEAQMASLAGSEDPNTYYVVVP